MPQILKFITEIRNKDLTKYWKPSLVAGISTALAITAFAPTPAGATQDLDHVPSYFELTLNSLADGAVETESGITAMAAELRMAPLETSAQFDYSVPAALPVSLPAPAYTPAADRQQVTEAANTSFDYLGDDLPTSNVGRSMSPSGIALLKALEGLELRGYKLGDGMCTIGYGHAEPLSTFVGNCTDWVITEEEAEAMLIEDVQVYADAVGNHFTRPLTQNQFDALTSFIYNVGPNILDTYGWSSEPSDDALTGAMLLYVFPAAFREGLTARRYAEIALFNS